MKFNKTVKITELKHFEKSPNNISRKTRIIILISTSIVAFLFVLAAILVSVLI